MCYVYYNLKYEMNTRHERYIKKFTSLLIFKFVIHDCLIKNLTKKNPIGIKTW